MITSVDEFTKRLQEIQDGEVQPSTGKMINPESEPVFTIDANTRIITVPSQFKSLGTWQEHNIETIYFSISRYFDNIDFYPNNSDNITKQIVVVYQLPDKNIYNSKLNIIQLDPKNNSKMLIGWILNNNVMSKVGNINFAITLYGVNDDGKIVYRFNTKPATVSVDSTFDFLNAGDDEELPPQYVDVDGILDIYSERPIANKVVAKAILDIQDQIDSFQPIDSDQVKILIDPDNLIS